MNTGTKPSKKSINRRAFVKDLALLSCGMVVLGNYGFIIANDENEIKAVVIDFSKCTGCRTCETVCSAYNSKVDIEGKLFMGDGNPAKANIQVIHFNPDIDVPNICAMCSNNPCIKACSVEPDKLTGRKALYKDKETSTVRVDLNRCIGCGNCKEACKSKRTGIIRQNKDNGSPIGICSLCNGDPKCVKYCTYGTLSYADILQKKEYAGLPPQKIAKILYEKMYLKNN